MAAMAGLLNHALSAKHTQTNAAPALANAATAAPDTSDTATISRTIF